MISFMRPAAAGAQREAYRAFRGRPPSPERFSASAGSRSRPKALRVWMTVGRRATQVRAVARNKLGSRGTKRRAWGGRDAAYILATTASLLICPSS